MQLFQNFLQFAKITPIKIEFTKFGVGFEPETIIFGILQRFQSCFIEILQ